MVLHKSEEPSGRRYDYISRVPSWIWLFFSFLSAMLLWYYLSVNPKTSRSFPFIPDMAGAVGTMWKRGVLWADISSSMISVFWGFFLGFLISVPAAYLMAWYRPVRYIVEPWIQFVRNIPPLAYVPLVVISAGVGRKPQIIVICLAVFLTSTITIYQGILNVNDTLIKAARVLGAKDWDIFIRVIIPASIPYMITAVRLGLSVALTTLIAAESTGAIAGMGMRIRSLSNSFEMAPMLLYIIILGIIGMVSEKIIKCLERKLTGWQEIRER